jgi:hypothetical protein
VAFSGVTERGSASERVSDASLGGSPSAAITVDKIAFVVLAFDNLTAADGDTTDNDTLTDTDGHTWNKVFEYTGSAGGAAADGVTNSLWWVKVTSEIGTGDTITFGTVASTTAKVMGFFEVTVGAGNTVQVADRASQALGGVGSVSPSVALSGLASKEYLLIGIVAREQEVLTWTEDTDYTNVFAAEGISSGPTGGATTNVVIHVGYRIATLTGDTFAPSLAEQTDIATTLVAFEEVADGGGGVAQQIAQAVETDLAQPISALKTQAVGLSAETDLAQGVTALKPFALGLAAETDSANPTFSRLTSPWTEPVEVRTFAGIDLVVETDSAFPVAGTQEFFAGQALEASEALEVTIRRGFNIGLPAETDVAQPTSHSFAQSVGQPVESDQAIAVSGRVGFDIGLVTESDAAQVLVVVFAVYRFTPPAGSDIRQLERRKPFFYYNIGNPRSVLIEGGVVSAVFGPDMGRILAADSGSGYANRSVFLGGRTWTITKAEKVILEAAGYTVVEE